MKLLIALAAVIAVAYSKSCLDCICQVESGCRAIGCQMDVGSLSCGYFQIKLPYYEDCGEPGKQAGESVQTAWKRCADDKTCATTCVQAYIRRFGSKCPGKGECEKTSRIHNGGPNGCHNGNTVGYWNNVRSCCGCS